MHRKKVKRQREQIPKDVHFPEITPELRDQIAGEWEAKDDFDICPEVTESVGFVQKAGVSKQRKPRSR